MFWLLKQNFFIVFFLGVSLGERVVCHALKCNRLISIRSIERRKEVWGFLCKVCISATGWCLFTLTAVALRFCRATEKTPACGGNKRRATAKSLNDLP
jgi:hypothetical protein